MKHALRSGRYRGICAGFCGRHVALGVMALALLFQCLPGHAEEAQRWTAARANQWYVQQRRPLGSNYIICTEYMARGAGSTIDGSLPVGKRANVGMINWGFVVGKTQTNFPWDSWQRPYTLQPPTVWFHDLLHEDGTPYRAREAEILRSLSATHP
jgi:hypothetical protein